MRKTATLLMSCSDPKGLVHKISDFIYRHGGNIVHADQHIRLRDGAVFFPRGMGPRWVRTGQGRDQDGGFRLSEGGEGKIECCFSLPKARSGLAGPWSTGLRSSAHNKHDTDNQDGCTDSYQGSYLFEIF